MHEKLLFMRLLIVYYYDYSKLLSVHKSWLILFKSLYYLNEAENIKTFFRLMYTLFGFNIISLHYCKDQCAGA